MAGGCSHIFKAAADGFKLVIPHNQGVHVSARWQSNFCDTPHRIAAHFLARIDDSLLISAAPNVGFDSLPASDSDMWRINYRFVLFGILCTILVSLISFRTADFTSLRSLRKGRPTKLGLDHIYIISADAARSDYFVPMLDFLNLDYEIFQGYTTSDKTLLDVLSRVLSWRSAQSHEVNNWAEGASEAQIAARIGCSASHIAVWKDMIRNGYESALIMEDDIDINSNIASEFPAILDALPQNWDMLYPGWCSVRWAPDKSFETPETDEGAPFHQLIRSACGHGYVLRLSTAHKFVAHSAIREPTYDTPWDVHVAHFVGDGVIQNVFGFIPQLIQQRPRSLKRPSLISTAEELQMNTTETFTSEDVVERGWRFRDAFGKNSSAAYQAGVSYWHDL